MPDALNNRDIRQLLRTHPVDAVTILYDRYAGALRSIARHLVHDPLPAEEIVQDVFVHVWLNAYRLGTMHDRSLEHYLVRVVRNRAMTYYTDSLNERERRKNFVREQGDTKSEDSFEAALIRSEAARELRRLIDTFPGREKDCLLLKLDRQMTNAQIASHLGISEKAVERSITSAYKRVRGRLRRGKDL